MTRPNSRHWWDVWDYLAIIGIATVTCFSVWGISNLYHLWPFSPERVDLWKYSLNNPANFSTEIIGPAEVDHPLDEDDVRRMIDSALAKRDKIARAKEEARAKDTLLPWVPLPGIIWHLDSTWIDSVLIGDTTFTPTKPPYNWNRFRGRKP